MADFMFLMHDEAANQSQDARALLEGNPAHEGGGSVEIRELPQDQ